MLFRRLSIIFSILALAVFAVGIFTHVASANHVTLQFFYGQGCPHCSHAKPFLASLEEKYPDLSVEQYEVWYNKGNQALFQQVITERGADVRGVPAFFIGDDYLVGYGGDETTGKQLEDLVIKYLGDDAGGVLLSDISANQYATAIQSLVEQDIIKGYEDHTFRPDNTINRAEFLKILMEARYPGQSAGGNCFSDVGLEWFARYVCFAKAQGIVGGYADGTFKPAHTINNAEALKMLTETFGFEVGEDDGEWYQKYVNAAKANSFYLESVMSAPVTRGAMAEMVYRILGA